MIISGEQKFIKTDFNDEAELESVVEKNYKQIFGYSSIYLPKGLIKTAGEFGTIPDGIVINFEDSIWYIVENERGEHETWRHIVRQVSKQITATKNDSALTKIYEQTRDFIKNNEEAREVLKELEIVDFDMTDRIREILDKDPIVAIPIDEIPADLEDWAETLSNKVEIWEIGKYVSQDTEEVIYLLPDELTPTLETIPESGRSIKVYELQGRDLILEMIDQGYVSPGDKLYMDYKPRGGEQHSFEAEILESGNLKVDGKEFSNSSYAAVHCIQLAGSDRETESGPRKWKIPNGKTLEEIREEIILETD